MSRRVPSASARNNWLIASSLESVYTTMWLYVSTARGSVQDLLGRRLCGGLVDPEDVAPRVGEGEPPPAGILVGLRVDPTSRSLDARQCGVEIVRTYEHEHALASGRCRNRVQPADLVVGVRGILDPCVLPAVVVELPAQRLGEEGLRPLEVVDRQFHVVDHVWHAQKGTPKGLVRRRSRQLSPNSQRVGFGSSDWSNWSIPCMPGSPNPFDGTIR